MSMQSPVLKGYHLLSCRRNWTSFKRLPVL